MNNKKLSIFIFAIFLVSSLYSQTRKTINFIQPILIDSGWSLIPSIVFTQFENKIINIKATNELEIRQTPPDQFWIRPLILSKKIFALELNSDVGPYFLVLIRNTNRINPDASTISENDTSKLNFDKFIDRKLYITTNTIPDELIVLWNNKLIPFKIRGNAMSIYLPNYIDKTEFSYIRIYAATNKAKYKELIIPLIYGKPSANMDRTTEMEAHVNVDENTIQLLDTFKVNKRLININDTSAHEIKTPTEKPSWISIYTDVYLAFYNDSVGTNQYQRFPGISPKNNAFGLNTFQINFQYTSDKFRSSASLHYGDYAKTSWSSEFNQIMEANFGLRIYPKLWIDGGFFRTYLGTEGLLPRENYCSSVSISTYYEPTYFSGIRLNFIPYDKLTLNLYLMNGYNGFEDNNSNKSIGMLASYTLNENINFGMSNYFGDDTPENTDSNSHVRFYQNAYINLQFNKLKFQIGADYCIQGKSDLDKPDKSAKLFSGVINANYSITKLISTYGRFEYFDDPNAILSTQIVDSKGKLTGYQLNGFTIGIQLNPLDQLYIRLEGRKLNMDADQKIFYRHNNNRNTRTEFMVNAGFSF